MVRYPCPMKCKTVLTPHCTSPGARCRWLCCATCHLRIDPQRWKAFNTVTGLPVTMPPRI